jgi:hypothetical protein
MVCGVRPPRAARSAQGALITRVRLFWGRVAEAERVVCLSERKFYEVSVLASVSSASPSPMPLA